MISSESQSKPDFQMFTISTRVSGTVSFPSPVKRRRGICVCDVEMYTLARCAVIALISPVRAQISSSELSSSASGQNPRGLKMEIAAPASGQEPRTRNRREPCPLRMELAL